MSDEHDADPGDDWDDDLDADLYDDPDFYERKPRRSVWKTIGIVVGVCLLCLLGFVALGMFYIWSARELPVEPEDRTVVIDAQELASRLDEFEPAEKHETFHRLKYIDGSLEILYDYTDEEDPTSPWIMCTVTYEKKASDATMAYGGLWLGYLGGFKVDGTIVDERNDLFSWGDSSHFGILSTEDGPYGNVFVARKGRMIFDVCFAGVYFDEAEWIKDLLKPVLDRAGHYRP